MLRISDVPEVVHCSREKAARPCEGRQGAIYTFEDQVHAVDNLCHMTCVMEGGLRGVEMRFGNGAKETLDGIGVHVQRTS